MHVACCGEAGDHFICVFIFVCGPGEAVAPGPSTLCMCSHWSRNILLSWSQSNVWYFMHLLCKAVINNLHLLEDLLAQSTAGLPDSSWQGHLPSDLHHGVGVPQFVPCHGHHLTPPVPYHCHLKHPHTVMESTNQLSTDDGHIILLTVAMVTTHLRIHWLPCIQTTYLQEIISKHSTRQLVPALSRSEKRGL